MQCSNCVFFKKSPPRLTAQQKWDNDPRPVARGFFQSLNNDYKLPLDEWDTILDDLTLYENEILGNCSRFPKSVSVSTTYYCGEFKEK